MNLEKLYEIISSRADAPLEDSYTARLLNEGLPRITQKVGEEGVEVVIAGLVQDDERLVDETADFFYHLLVLLYARKILLEQVWAELERRNQK